MSDYPGIARATLLIALDNGGINRNRSEDRQREECAAWLNGRSEDLTAIDAWLAGLSEQELETTCCGEDIDMAAMVETAPGGTNQFLNDYFDEVC